MPSAEPQMRRKSSEQPQWGWASLLVRTGPLQARRRKPACWSARTSRGDTRTWLQAPGGMREDLSPLFHHSELANLGQLPELGSQKRQPSGGEGLLGLRCPEDSPGLGWG